MNVGFLVSVSVKSVVSNTVDLWSDDKIIEEETINSKINRKLDTSHKSEMASLHFRL